MFLPSFSYFVLFLFGTQFAIHINALYWGEYPKCATPYLQAAAPTRCAHKVYQSQAACLCASKPFLVDAATSIGTHCGCKVLNRTAIEAGKLCNGYDWYMAITPSEMILEGTACESSVPAMSASPGPTVGGGGGGGGGLSQGSKIGIGVGIGIGVFVLLGVVLAFLRRRLPRAATSWNDKVGEVELQHVPGEAAQQAQQKVPRHTESHISLQSSVSAIPLKQHAAPMGKV